MTRSTCGPAGGGKAKRIIKGLAGPDMTLGTEAVRARQAGCGAIGDRRRRGRRHFVGTRIDLMTNVLHAPGGERELRRSRQRSATPAEARARVGALSRSVPIRNEVLVFLGRPLVMLAFLARRQLETLGVMSCT